MASHRAALVAALVVAALAAGAQAYYLPGTYPREFAKGDPIQIEVNSMISSQAELPYDYYSMPFCKPPEGVRKSGSTINPGTILLGMRIENSPYNLTVLEEADARLACAGPDYPKGAAPPLSGKEAKTLRDRIRDGYHVRLILDNLPVTTYDLSKSPSSVRPGFPVGYKLGNRYYVNNHLMFNVLYHETSGEFAAKNARLDQAAAIDATGRKLLADRGLAFGLPGEGDEPLGGGALGRDGAARPAVYRPGRSLAGKSDESSSGKPARRFMIVGFEVVACSIRRDPGRSPKSIMCPESPESPTAPEGQQVKRGESIVYTYDVYWVASKVTWSTRWELYLHMPAGRVHWFSILNSLLVVVLMTFIVAMIMFRTVRRDLAHYEALLVDPAAAAAAAAGGAGAGAAGAPGQPGAAGPPGSAAAAAAAAAADAAEESGWKLVAGDVFRTPDNPLGLAVRVGSGAQILASAGITLAFAALGLLSPAARGSLLTAALVLYMLLTVAAGYAAVWCWAAATRSAENWFRVAWRVACFFPGTTALALTALNAFLWGSGSTGAIPLGFFFSAVAVWLLVSIPLAFAGGALAARREVTPWPTRTNQIPRHVPPPHWTSHPAVLFLAAGLLPFGTIFVELYFAMNSLWRGYYYYIYGFLLVVALLSVVITIEVSVVCTYVQLGSEDYHWWWASFHRGGSVALYVALYAAGFLVWTLNNLAGPLAVLLYITYMGLLSWCIYLGAGTIGFLASLIFTVKIFESVKAD